MKNILYLFTFIACLCLSACGGDDDEPDKKYQDISLDCGQTYTIQNGGGVTWTSSNEYIASIEGNVVTAERVGEATISSSKGSFKVTVKGTLTAYNVPCIEWGKSINTVKNFMKGRTPDEETPTSLTYTGTGAELLTLYKFENNGLVSSGLALDGNYTNSEQLVDFLLENYIPISVDEENYMFYFVTIDMKTAVALNLQASGGRIIYIIVYIPFDGSKGVPGIQEIEWREFDSLGLQSSPIVANKFSELISKF